jgi:hypothetical protein
MSSLRNISIPAICHERLNEWAKQMGDHNATPMLALAVGHGPNAGELHLYTVSNISDDDLEMFLAFALREIKFRKADRV